MESHINRPRWLKNPNTEIKELSSVIRDEIYLPATDQPEWESDWGNYRFGAWLEEEEGSHGKYLISLPYWRNKRFAGQYTLRVEPAILKTLFMEMQRRGLLDLPGWSDSPVNEAEAPPES